MSKTSKIFIATALLLPNFVFAAESTFSKFVTKINGWFSLLIPLLIALGLIYFLWGVFMYIKASSDDASKVKSRQIMYNGVIALFVMVSVWGLVNLLQTSLGIGGGGAIQVDTNP